MKRLLSWIMVAAVLLTGMIASSTPKAAQAEGEWTCHPSQSLVVSVSFSVSAVNEYRLTGSGSGLPTATIFLSSDSAPNSFTWVLPGPGPWSNITLEWRRLPYEPDWDISQYSNLIIVEGCTGALPGCDVMMPIPPTAVVGRFLDSPVAHWAPGHVTVPPVVLPVGTSAWVIGVDASGAYYKIAWSCDFLWVPVESMGPNYDEVWNGWPLPTTVVE